MDKIEEINFKIDNIIRQARWNQSIGVSFYRGRIKAIFSKLPEPPLLSDEENVKYIFEPKTYGSV